MYGPTGITLQRYLAVLAYHVCIDTSVTETFCRRARHVDILVAHLERGEIRRTLSEICTLYIEHGQWWREAALRFYSPMRWRHLRDINGLRLFQFVFSRAGFCESFLTALVYGEEAVFAPIPLIDEAPQELVTVVAPLRVFVRMQLEVVCFLLTTGQYFHLNLHKKDSTVKLDRQFVERVRTICRVIQEHSNRDIHMKSKWWITKNYKRLLMVHGLVYWFWSFGINSADNTKVPTEKRDLLRN